MTQLIIFVNGPFGVGKTTAVAELNKLIPDALIIDPEKVGHMLWAQLPEVMRMEEFELEPIWPALTRTLIEQVHRTYGRDLLIPMTIVRPRVFGEIVQPIRDLGIAVTHVTLLAQPETIRERLRQRGEGPDRWGELSWEGLQVERCLASLALPVFATHIDTEHLTPPQIAAAVITLAGLADPEGRLI
ncbi:AAA family ATPase [Actinospica sp. MGRD01-02]|uniref:AAA family ATPase n=1 Tax=Actinospica acidithermotolerans TaxID=2828514 RepID=A0A941IJK7_9ACTN|nr:AAA family ATPase [Actinospica acidithermotolerans]MBR7825806.1 AAA family ATPase [Actinospica acidithermotolerans]